MKELHDKDLGRLVALTPFYSDDTDNAYGMRIGRRAIEADRELNAESHDPLTPQQMEVIADPTLRAVCEAYTNTPGGHFVRLQAVAKLVHAPADRDVMRQALLNARDALQMCKNWSDPEEGEEDGSPFPALAVHRAYSELDGLLSAAPTPELGDPAEPRDDSDRTYTKPIGYLPAYELLRLHSGHDAQLRSAKFGPSVLDGDVPVFIEAPTPPAEQQGEQEPVAWLTRDNDDEPAMLFFDPAEAAIYCDADGKPEPLYKAPSDEADSVMFKHGWDSDKGTTLAELRAKVEGLPRSRFEVGGLWTVPLNGVLAEIDKLGGGA